ncbi:hypothetical protein SEA_PAULODIABOLI_317 [Microbacterium phage PauloDiaboli]|nr:hypothetical protein SEA_PAULODIABOLI_317 [Microbacterium phage PauloDiaboli]
MSSVGHHVNVCVHGTQLGQCRCAAPDKTKMLVGCLPSHAGWTEDEHPILYTGTIGGVAQPVKVAPFSEPVQKQEQDRPLPLAVTYSGIADVLEAEGWRMVSALELDRFMPMEKVILGHQIGLLGRLSRRFRELDNPSPLE